MSYTDEGYNGPSGNLTLSPGSFIEKCINVMNNTLVCQRDSSVLLPEYTSDQSFTTSHDYVEVLKEVVFKLLCIF